MHFIELRCNDSVKHMHIVRRNRCDSRNEVFDETNLALPRGVSGIAHRTDSPGAALPGIPLLADKEHNISHPSSDLLAGWQGEHEVGCPGGKPMARPVARETQEPNIFKSKQGRPTGQRRATTCNPTLGAHAPAAALYSA